MQFSHLEKNYIGLNLFSRTVSLLELLCFNSIVELLIIYFFIQSCNYFYLTTFFEWKSSVFFLKKSLAYQLNFWTQKVQNQNQQCKNFKLRRFKAKNLVKQCGKKHFFFTLNANILQSMRSKFLKFLLQIF